MNNRDNNMLTASDKLLGIFLIIVVAIIPVVCKVNQIQVSAEEFQIIRSGSSVVDVFSYSKSVLILTMGVIVAIFMAFQILGEDGFTIDFKSKPVILAGIYIILALVSAIFSHNHHTAFLGLSERYEGFFVWLCYMVFMVVAMGFSSSAKRLNFILSGFLISGIILGIIGTFQYFGMNIFASETFLKIIMGKYYNGQPMIINFESVFATLYNPNCAGMYYAMMFSAIGVMAVLMPFRNKTKWFFAIVAVLLLICALGSDSVGSLIGIICGIGFVAIVCIIYYTAVVKSRTAIIATGSGVAVIAVALIILFNSNAVIVQKFKVITDALNGNVQTESLSFYEDVYVDGMLGKVVTKDGEYAIDYSGEATQLMHNGQVLDPVSSEPMEGGNGTIYMFNESGVDWIMSIYTRNNMQVVELAGLDKSSNRKTSFNFGEVEGKLTVLDKMYNPVDVNNPVAAWGFKGIERLGSNRGYIWSRSLPLLLKHIIIGAGPDCFAFEFPQNDVRSKLNYLGNPYVILDKPHNMYLQLGINTGVISLVVMLVLFVMYIVQTVKKVFKDRSQVLNAVRLGILAGVIAYLAAAMTTDSVVSVAPVFWVLLGTGFGANVISSEEK